MGTVCCKTNDAVKTSVRYDTARENENRQKTDQNSSKLYKVNQNEVICLNSPKNKNRSASFERQIAVKNAEQSLKLRLRHHVWDKNRWKKASKKRSHYGHYSKAKNKSRIDSDLQTNANDLSSLETANCTENSAEQQNDYCVSYISISKTKNQFPETDSETNQQKTIDSKDNSVEKIKTTLASSEQKQVQNFPLENQKLTPETTTSTITSNTEQTYI